MIAQMPERHGGAVNQVVLGPLGEDRTLLDDFSAPFSAGGGMDHAVREQMQDAVGAGDFVATFLGVNQFDAELAVKTNDPSDLLTY